MAIATAASIWGQFAVAHLAQQVEQINQSSAEPRKIHVENQRLKSQLQQINQQQAAQLKLRSPFSPLAVIELLHALKLKLAGQLQVKSLDFVNGLTSDANRKEAPGEQGHVQLELVAPGTANSSAIIQGLRDSKLFRSVELNSGLQKLNSNSEDLQFTVRCTF
jgi:hypothetical protein